MGTIGAFFTNLFQWFYTLFITVSHWVVDSALEMVTNIFWVGWWALGHVFRWYFSLMHDLMNTVLNMIPAYSGDLSFTSDYLRVGLALVDLVCPLAVITGTLTSIVGVLMVALAIRAVLTFIPTIGG